MRWTLRLLDHIASHSSHTPGVLLGLWESLGLTLLFYLVGLFPNFMCHIAYRGSLFFSQPLQHLPWSSIAHPEAGSSHSCLRAVLWMDPTKVPQWLFGCHSLNTLETPSATTLVPSILLFNIRCLCYMGVAENSVQWLLYVKIHCHEPLFPGAKHKICPEALHGTAQSKYKNMELLMGSARSRGLLMESERQRPQSGATRRAQHRLCLLPPCILGWRTAGR